MRLLRVYLYGAHGESHNKLTHRNVCLASYLYKKATNTKDISDLAVIMC